jgi:DNA-binding LacI/PurR family transcriptional regulator
MVTPDPSTPARSPTLEDVAQVAGVSRATVSRVVNNTRNVDPAIHEVVWRAITETGYVPNRAARSLVTRRTGTVALIVSDSQTHTDDDPFMSRFFADPYFGRVVGGLMSVLRERGVQLALQLVGTQEARQRLVGDLRQGQADGSVVLSLHPEDTLPELLVEAGLTAVLIGRPWQPTPISYVDLANDAGAVLAAEHLIGRGCRQIAMITGPAHVPSSLDRIACFRQAMARSGVAFFPSAAGTFTHDTGERAMDDLLREYPDIDGVFAANDLMAQGALVALQRAGRRVPDDVAVVGFDDSSVAAAARPALTTVRQPVEDMAARSAEMLLSRVDDPTLRPTSVVFSPTLILRASA